MSIRLVSKRFSEVRDFIGMSIHEGATSAGMADDELEAIENGARTPTELELRRIANAYSVHTAFFTETDGDRKDEGTKLLGGLANELSGTDRTEVLNLAAYLRHSAGIK